MPYITQRDRRELLERPEDRKIATSGELNFMLTTVIEKYLKGNGRSYKYYNDCIGALEGCKLELYRRMIAPYEDEKIEKNGDVYRTKQQREETNPSPQLRREGVEL